MTTDKKPTSYRLSDEAKAMVAELTRLLGVSSVDVVEAAIRVLYRWSGRPALTPEQVERAVRDMAEKRRARRQKPGRRPKAGEG
jgi:Mg-chelatase subunit ChlI